MIPEKIRTSEPEWNEESVLAESKRNPKAFDVIYTRYYKRIFVFIHHRVGDKQTSADITQQVFLNALVNLGKYQFRGLPFSSWLFRIAINECNRYFRNSKRMRLVVIEEASMIQLYEELIADNTKEELYQRLPDILQKLQPAELQFIELRYFEERPFKEIGDIFEITETHAKVKTYRVIDKIKKIFLRNEI